MKQPITCLLLTIWCVSSHAQEKWDLRRAVDYAVSNNISVKRAELDVRLSELNYKLNKASRLPAANLGMNSGYRLGRSENPTTGVLEDNNFFNTGINVQSGVTLFNWFSIKHSIEAGRLSVEADKARAKKVQDDIALNVAVAYLQTLLAKEQVSITTVQVEQTKAQLEVTRKKVAAGTLPELNAAELEAQLARDSSSLITAQTNVQRQLLQMKALLNLDAGMAFDITAPPVESIPVENLADLQPETVYNLAIHNLPQQRANELRLSAAFKNIEVARSSMYPTLSAFGNLYSNYVYFRKPIYAQVINGFQNTGLRVDAGNGIFYTVQSPVVTQGGKTGQYFSPQGFTNQLNANFGQGIGLSLQVPIANGRNARSSWDRSKLTVHQLRLQNEQDQQTLKQDIYEAYTDAIAAVQKYNASKKSVAAAEKAYSFAEKRYALALLSTYDLLNAQTSLLRARIDMLSAQFDYIFKMKLLEFYKGQGLKL